MLLAATFTSCLDDGDETIVLEEEKISAPNDTNSDHDNSDDINLDDGGTSVVSSSESSTINYAGFKLTVPYGAVPKNSSGSDGRVAFSLQQTNEMPAALPSGLEVIPGTNIKIEPMNFTFNTPLIIDVPLKGYDAKTVTLYRFNDATNTWEPVPFIRINNNGTASVALIELGHFILVKNNGVTSNLGGVHITKNNLQGGYFYYLTLVPTTGNMYNIKRIAVTSNEHDLYMSNVPKGTYTVYVARENRNDLSSASGIIEYFQTTINVVNSVIAGNGDFSTYTGWTELGFPSTSWTSGRPDGAWGIATTTYGTGKFQVTLTWVNSTGSVVDYDLHLYGPDFHVFYSSKQSPNFELDRDWTSPLGNAVENIYSINDNFTPGTYTVKVHHFSGVTGKRYNCRVLMDGVVVKSVSGTTNETDDIYSFDIN